MTRRKTTLRCWSTDDGKKLVIQCHEKDDQKSPVAASIQIQRAKRTFTDGRIHCARAERALRKRVGAPANVARWYISDVHVDEDLRGQGMATELYQKAFEAAQEASPNGAIVATSSCVNLPTMPEVRFIWERPELTKYPHERAQFTLDPGERRRDYRGRKLDDPFGHMVYLRGRR